MATAVLVVAAGLAWKTGAEAAEAARRTPSGLPVPRYVSLKFGEVNARAGPGDDYKLLWTYRVRGLPLQVIAETADWRRVCDPEGAAAWVHQRTVDTRRTVMRIRPEPLPMHRRAEAKSQTVAVLAGRALASLDTCRDGWCRIEAGRVKGWTPAGELWGADERPQCGPRGPAPR
jgi:SH3-like domain-containing protein